MATQDLKKEIINN